MNLNLKENVWLSNLLKKVEAHKLPMKNRDISSEGGRDFDISKHDHLNLVLKKGILFHTLVTHPFVSNAAIITYSVSAYSNISDAFELFSDKFFYIKCTNNVSHIFQALPWHSYSYWHLLFASLSKLYGKTKIVVHVHISMTFKSKKFSIPYWQVDGGQGREFFWCINGGAKKWSEHRARRQIDFFL